MRKIKKILIFGADGMLGQEFMNHLKHDKLRKFFGLKAVA